MRPLENALWVCSCLSAFACADPTPEPLRFTAVTFNTGSSGVGTVDPATNGGYGPKQAAFTDQYYGNGLAWPSFIEETRQFLAAVAPDIVGFQELFYSGECPNIPEEARVGFACETWQMGDLTEVQTMLGDQYQIACHQEKPDKCLAVKRSFGRFVGCDVDFCLDGLDGHRIEGCGSGSRIGRGVIELEGRDGETLTVVNVHGSSGVASSDAECRTKQFQLVFEDFGQGDGAPATNGTQNLVLGDFNTDPYRLMGDPSADLILEHVGPGRRFRFHSDAGLDAVPSYATLFNIDHVMSDVFEGGCYVPGVTEGKPAVMEYRFFDHKPAVCSLRKP